MKKRNEKVNAPEKNAEQAVAAPVAAVPQENNAPVAPEQDKMKDQSLLPYISENGVDGQNTGAADSAMIDCKDQYDKYRIEDEHIRYLGEVKKLDKIKNRKSAAKKEAIANSDSKDKDMAKAYAESSAELVGARMKYDIGAGNSELAIELLKFGSQNTSQKSELAEQKKRLKNLKKSIKKAKKLEKKATTRYYTVLYKEAESPAVAKKAKKQERLKAVVAKLETLLNERESLDKRLAALYRGAENRSGGKVRVKAERKRYKVAKKVHRSLKASYNRFNKMDIPESLKIKIRYLFNTKIVSKSTVAYSKYLLKKLKPKGAARAELKRNIRKAEKSLALLEVSLKKLTKKANKLNEKRINRKAFFRTFLFLVILAVIAGVCIYVLGNK